jgi:peptide/nickel transport system permease protein
VVAFTLRRAAQSIPVLFGVSIVAWALVALAPGDASQIYARQFAESGRPTAEEIARSRVELGLDGNPVEQYVTWLRRAITGDFGRSFSSGSPVSAELKRRAGPTVQLALAATFITIGIGVTAGIIASLSRDRWPDNLARLVALVGGALPSFWLSLVLIWLFAVKINWFPSFGRGGVDHLVLPALALGLGGAGAYTRLVRASMLDVLSQDYITVARAKGLPGRTVLFRHAFRNAMFPAVTQAGLTLGALLGGAAIVETIFAWPGLGKLTVDAISAHDYPVVQSVVLVSALTYVVVNLAVDILYRLLDPRLTQGPRT